MKCEGEEVVAGADIIHLCSGGPGGDDWGGGNLANSPSG